MGGTCETEAYEDQQGGNGMNDQDGRQAVSGGGREGEVAVGAAAAVRGEQAISAVAQLWTQTCAIVVAVAKDAEVVLLEAAQRDALDDGCGEGAEEQ